MIIGKAVGDYRILARWGPAECRCVYKALHVTQRQLFAVKLLKASPAEGHPLQQAFFDRLEVAVRLENPCIARTYPLETCQDLSVVPSEFVHGQSLAEKIQAGQSSFDFTLRTALQFAEALVAAHSLGLVHGRLTPSRLMITAEGSLKIVGFCMAFLPSELEVVDPGPEWPPSGSTLVPLVADAAYLSPQQARGTSADEGCDLYSLGRIIYELLVGEFLIRGQTLEEIQREVLERDFLPLNSVRHDASSIWTRILQKLLKKDPQSRCPSAQSLLESLRELRNGIYSYSSPPPQKNRPLSRRSFFLRFLGDKTK